MNEKSIFPYRKKNGKRKSLSQGRQKQRETEPDDEADSKYIQQDFLSLPDTYIVSTKKF